MTAAAEASGAGVRRHLLWAALVISLAINVFFVGTMVWLRMESAPPTPAERMQALGKELNLSDNQRESFRHFVQEMRRNTMQLRESNQPLIQQVWQEVGKPNPDVDLINKLVDQATENRHVYQKTMTGVLTRFLAGLTPEQRAAFVESTKVHHDQRAQHLRRLILP